MSKYTYIICGKLYNGIDAEFKEGYKILVKDNKIEAVGREIPQPETAEVVDLSDATVTPGMIDAHMHMDYIDWHTIREEVYTTSEEAKTIAIIRTAQKTLSRGFTTVRHPGGITSNGFGVLEWMNRFQWIDETPVIMISSEESVDTMRKAYEMGITDYITRPFDSVIVKKRVQNTLALYANQKRLVNVVVDQVYEKEENNNIMIGILSNVLGFRNSESSEHILHIKTATEMMLRKLVKVTEAYPLTEADIALITTASSLHDIGKVGIPEEILNKPGRLTDEEFKIMKTHSEIGASLIRDMRFPKDKPLVHTAWEICRWHHERWDGKGYPDGLKGEEIPISAQVVSIVDVYDALTSERCYKKAFDHDTAIRMILDGQCGQFNPVLLKCLKELSLQFSRMFTNKPDDNKQYYEAQRLSDEILREKSLPRKNYSQRVIELMQEKIEFFKTNSGKTSIEYNVISGQLSIMNEKQQVICQRNDPKYDISNVFEVNREDIRQVSNLLDQTSIQNKEVSLHVMAKVGNKRQMCALKLHTLWSPLKKDGYIGIIGYFESI